MKLPYLSLGAGVLGLAMIAPAAPAAAQKPGSTYVQCDGNPDNVTSGETAARLLGAVTLLGLFAPAPEAPDASKRKFGAEGVAACTTLIEGEKRESHAKRRIGLILARAIHHIEAKNYEAAIADTALGRREAEAAGFMADPYFARSRGRAFDLVESAALVRLGRVEEAQQVSLRGTAPIEYSVLELISTPTYSSLIAKPTEAEDKVLQWQTRLIPFSAPRRADRLDLAGRFAESAKVRDAMVEFDAEHTPDLNQSLPLAQAAVAHALAGNAAAAAERARAARANADKRKAEGKPEEDAAEFVELMDLYSILETAHSGDVKAARRLFAARSQWVAASLGAVIEVNRRLRQGAAPDELIGGLARDGAELWKERAEGDRAAMLAKDTDNKTLFALARPLVPASGYHSLSKKAWRADKSKFILKMKKPPTTVSKLEVMFHPFVDPRAAMEAYLLHAALIAQSRGHQGFVFAPIVTDTFLAASFRTGNRGDKGFADEFFIPADEAIVKIAQVLPDPATLAAKKAK